VREKRDEIIILRTTKAEKNRIYEKMLGMGIRSLSAYIRKMALDGYCLHLDLKELRRMAYLLQMCSNNLNQYAKCANESGQVYAADLEDLRIRLDELISIGKTDRTITIPAVRCCGLHRFTTHFRPHQAENLQSHPNHSAQTALDENAR
jgi:hypothetical protein